MKKISKTLPLYTKLTDVKTILGLLKFIKKHYANKHAVCLSPNNLKSFNDLYNDVLKVAASLKKYKGNIGLYCANSYWFEVTALAIMVSQKTVVCFPRSINQEQLTKLCKQFDVSVLCHDDHLPNNYPIKALQIESLFKTNAKFNISSKLDPKKPACILLTGGTTGTPKGVVLSHDALVRGMMNGCYGLKRIYYQRYLCLIPLTHSFGFVRNMLTALYTGSCIYYNINKTNIFKEMLFFNPSVLIVVPNLAELFLNLIKAHGKQILGGQVHTIICGGSNVPPYLCMEYHKLAIDFFPGYGLTELANLVTGNMEAYKVSNSVGKLFPQEQAKIIKGELWLKGRNLMLGYYKNDKVNRQVMNNGWFKTGDLATIDADHNIYILGRINDLIVLDNGEKISPAYLENKILNLDIVQDCLVYLDKTITPHKLVCEVVLRQIVAKTIKNPRKYLNDALSKINKSLLYYEQISKIIIRDNDFKRTSSLKIIRNK